MAQNFVGAIIGGTYAQRGSLALLLLPLLALLLLYVAALTVYLVFSWRRWAGITLAVACVVPLIWLAYLARTRLASCLFLGALAIAWAALSARDAARD